MKLDYFNTFDTTTLPNSFAWVCAGGGSNNLVYNTTYQAIDCPGFSYTLAGLSTLTKANSDNVCIYEADVEFVADRVGNKAIGIALVSNFTSGSVTSYIFLHLNATWCVAKTTRYSNHTDASTTILSPTLFSNPTFNVGERKVLRIDFQYGFYRCYVDGIEVLRFADLSFTGLMPAVYYTNATLRIHSMKLQIGDDVVVSLSTLKLGLAWANNETRAQAWPGEISKRGIGVRPNKLFSLSSPLNLLSPPKRQEVGFISGQITRKSTPASGQLVYCFDERFNLVCETVSDTTGLYRFDGLSLGKLYTVIAQDNWDFKYAPVGADRRTPEAYS